MNKRARVVIAAAGLVGALGAGTTIAVASGGDDAEAPISGAALERASAAALAHTGGGKVTETELGDEESYYEVEVTKPDGTQVDVQLDTDFEVVGTKTDSDAGDDTD